MDAGVVVSELGPDGSLAVAHSVADAVAVTVTCIGRVVVAVAVCIYRVAVALAVADRVTWTKNFVGVVAVAVAYTLAVAGAPTGFDAGCFALRSAVGCLARSGHELLPWARSVVVAWCASGYVFPDVLPVGYCVSGDGCRNSSVLALGVAGSSCWGTLVDEDRCPVVASLRGGFGVTVHEFRICRYGGSRCIFG